MILKVFCVHDCKSEAFMNPFCMVSSGAAVRAFETTVNDPNTEFGKYPGDFTLYEVAEFDDSTGLFKSLPHHIHLGVASSFVKKSAAPKVVRNVDPIEPRA